MAFPLFGGGPNVLFALRPHSFPVAIFARPPHCSGMDNLTHSLVGALFGQMGLKRRTGLAMPTLIIAANLPDIDATCTVFGMRSLEMRRGLTHGPIALLLLPIVLAAAMLAWDRWQERRGRRPAERPPVRFGWLLALSYIGCLSHPALDWMNSYGVRLLEPFSSRWFYGDVLFIIDLWIWIALALAMFVSLRRERRGTGDWQRPAWIGFAAVGAYIFANGLITGRAEAEATASLAAAHGHAPDIVVANPQPLAFWTRQMLWRDGTAYGAGEYALGQPLRFGPERRSLNPGVDLSRVTRNNPDARAFLFWSRMPVIERKGTMYGLTDQRFEQISSAGSFPLLVPAE